MPTGHGSAVTLTTSGLSLDVIDLTPPSFGGESVPLPKLSIAKGSPEPQSPADVVTPGTVVIVVQHDEAYVPPLMVLDDVVITYPVPPGLTNGATDTHADAFLVSYEPSSLSTGERRTATLTIQVQDLPTKVAAS